MKLNPLDNQVAGHDGVLSMGEGNEIVVKPTRAGELQFYEEAVLHPELQVWMPAYYGTLTLARQPPQEQQQGEGGSHQLNPQQPLQDRGSSPVAVALGQSITPPLYQTQGHGEQSSMNGAKLDDDVCICLENLSHGFYKPCILDLKLGVQLFDEHASEAKKARLTADAASTTSGTLGIRLTGFRVYDSDIKEFIVHDKAYGKSLAAENILDGIRLYFGAKLGPKRMRLVLERFVDDLAEFLATIETLELRMRASSLLLVYEGDPEAFDQALLLEREKITEVVTRAKTHRERGDSAQNSKITRDRGEKGGNEKDAKHTTGDKDENETHDSDDSDEEDEEDYTQKITDMRLIDFGRSTWTPGQGPDEGVVLGVRNAHSYFKKLLEQDYPEEDE